ncbi:MAG: DUF2891 domain-containing protein [Planctomycetes bacterium]|nr:DUF2891 domain-containing protein [Planctomycetota bacterium]
MRGATHAVTETERQIEQFVQMALACVRREYPYHLSCLLNSAADLRAPREITPAFYGCFDWHSAVHGHWTLARGLRAFPDGAFRAAAEEALAEHLTAERLRAECDFAAARATFELPYGLAWVLLLASELRALSLPAARRWSEALEPLERLAMQRIQGWLQRVTHPIRGGEHSQSAFSMGLALDYAEESQQPEFAALIRARAGDFYLHDRAAPLDYEPSGHDFLSPALAEADLMRRVLSGLEYGRWLRAFLPRLAGAPPSWLAPVRCADASDGKLAHFDGLNLSRAWMLEGIASALPARDSLCAPLDAAARAHRAAGLAEVNDRHYAGGHWLATFALYLVTKRGLRPS